MKYFAYLCVTLALLLADESPQTGAQADGRADAKARGMMRLVAASEVFQAFPQSCPLAIYKTKANRPGPVADCFRNPRQCMRQCEAGNRNACFNAAQVIEKGQNKDDNRVTYRLYMDGCARGDGNACVNAGAAVRNTSWSEGKPPAAQRAKCQFTTYKRMCDDRHPWGCYMTAKEYLRSDGYRAKSNKQHDRYMREACKINAKSGACRSEYR